MLAPLLGLERLRAEVRASPLPVVAIGGVGLATVTEVARTGVHGVAVASDLWAGGDLRARVEALQRGFLLGETPGS